jgi:hypothetical protein
VSAIGASIIDGMIIAILNKVMLTVLAAVEPSETTDVVFGLDFITLLGTEWTLFIFALNVGSVLSAYAIKNWLGVVLYLGGWFFVASQISVIGIGAFPIAVGLALLGVYEYLRLS